MNERTPNVEATKRRLTSFIAEIDPNEMACRILEGAMGLKRPDGATAVQALSHLDPDARAGMYKAALNACEYLVEVIKKGERPT